MNKKMLLLLFAVIVGPLNCFAEFRDIAAFAKRDPEIFKAGNIVLEQVVGNMPKVESQDSLGICFAFSSAAVLQQFYCTKKKLDCQNLDLKKKISPLQMAAFSTNGDPENIKDLESYDSIQEGGSGRKSLINAIDVTQMGFTDSCFPWDQFVSKHGEDPQVHAAIFEKLKTAYVDHKKTEATFCLDCLSKTLQQEFDMKIDDVRLLEALRTKTYQHFLYAIFLKDRENDPVNTYCKDLIGFSTGSIEIFPKEKGVISNYKDVMEVIKKVTANKMSLNLDGICMERKENGECVCTEMANGKCVKEARHSVAIAGYEKACLQTDACKNSCEKKGCYREAVKIHNSWGKSWQNKFDGGWVDAETLIKETEPLSKGILSWINPVKP